MPKFSLRWNPLNSREFSYLNRPAGIVGCDFSLSASFGEIADASTRKVPPAGRIVRLRLNSLRGVTDESQRDR